MLDSVWGDRDLTAQKSRCHAMNLLLHFRLATLGKAPFFALLAALTAFPAGCGGKPGKSKTDRDAADSKSTKMVVSSPAFKNGEPIPKEYTADGQNKSPSLVWTKIPRETKEFILVCEDLDSLSAEPKIHWFACHIASEMTNVQEQFPASPFVSTTQGFIYQSINAFGRAGYSGPDPPKGTGPHRYRFHVRALDTSIRIAEGATPTATDILTMVSGHVIGEGELIGTYER